MNIIKKLPNGKYEVELAPETLAFLEDLSNMNEGQSVDVSMALNEVISKGYIGWRGFKERVYNSVLAERQAFAADNSATETGPRDEDKVQETSNVGMNFGDVPKTPFDGHTNEPEETIDFLSPLRNLLGGNWSVGIGNLPRSFQNMQGRTNQPKEPETDKEVSIVDILANIVDSGDCQCGNPLCPNKQGNGLRELFNDGKIQVFGISLSDLLKKDDKK